MTASNEDYLDLSPDDRRLLDSLAESGFDEQAVAKLPPADRDRASRLMGLLSLLRDYPVETSGDGSEDTLVHATLAGIDRYEDDRAARLSFDAQVDASEVRRRRLRVPDFISVAAVLLVAAGILLPATNYLRQRSLDAGCANNLREIGYAFSQYAGDNANSLPFAAPSTTWEAQANIANLFPLVSGKYCDLGHLRCPGAESHRTSYSYQCQPPDQRLVWGGEWGGEPSAMVVLGDSNPLVEAFLDGKKTSAMTMSLNHGGRGQNVLRTDAATMWLQKPVLGRDNIWLPDGEEVLLEGARPSRRGDVFLIQ